MITVRREGDRVVIDVDGQRLVLSVNKARVLVSRLGEALGMRVSLGKPLTNIRRVPGGYVVVIVEGRGAKTVTVPAELIKRYIEACRRMGPGRRRVRDYVAGALRGYPPASRFYRGGGLDWESLFGHRDDYYNLVRGPILLLERLGVLSYSHGYVTLKRC